MACMWVCMCVCVNVRASAGVCVSVHSTNRLHQKKKREKTKEFAKYGPHICI